MNRRLQGNRGLPSFSQQPFQSGGGSLNPWQGASNTNQAGILSQLTSNPQLALALSSLLQPQQQQPPSLLSLNTSPAFSGNRDYGHFNSGGANRGRAFRRHEPYNKNRSNFGGNNFRSRKSPKRDTKKPDLKKKDEKKVKIEATDEAGDDEKKETKRDWKDEKNQVEGKESGDEAEGGEGKKEGANKDGKFGGVPRKYLHCFVCTKQMWDGESMSKHVRGRAHREMLKALEESIHICVNILRENLRLQEERKLIEFNRQNRLRKFGQRRDPQLSHCAMCDLKFMGKIISHRRTEGHQRLKRYLHPNCRICDKEYPSRIEWVEHCLTPEHLRRSSESTEKREDGKHGDEIVESVDDVDMDEALEESLHMEGEDPILDLEGSLLNMVDRLPAYKAKRAIAPSALEQFAGWRCSLCHRSFPEKEDADAHLMTKKHYYRFIEHIKERFDREEKRKKAEKEAAEKKKNEDPATKETTEENGVTEEATEGEVDQEMYDPNEAGEDEDTLLADDPEKEPANADVEIETTIDEEEEETEQEVVKEPEPTPKQSPRKVTGPKGRRGRK
ncbi:zinc finger protein on ecdysone puffs-like isoform X2 [Euwallacea fornicatus]|uniref:zinc finger protein on ecdysone puffs-like isoform X2 n=1 Tax=Euwallacea fornicatus TaxID=995702 RepID=UPI00338EDA46